MTILLVTHFMEEATRLCDRVAVIDDGLVIALDDPAALAADAGGAEQRMRFRAVRADRTTHVLTDLPEVETVKADNGAGRGDRHAASWSTPSFSAARRARRDRPADVRLTTPTLEDAFVRLDGPRDDEHDDPAYGVRARSSGPRCAWRGGSRSAWPSASAFPLVLLIVFASIPGFRNAQPSLGGLTYFGVYLPVLVALVVAAARPVRPADATGELPRAGRPAPAVDHAGAAGLGARRPADHQRRASRRCR